MQRFCNPQNSVRFRNWEPNKTMKKYLFLIAALAATQVLAEDDMYVRGINSNYDANCTNTTARTDGTPVSAGEISQVVYYIDVVDGNLTNPAFSVTMFGGCTATPVDLLQFAENTTYYKYATTQLTDGLVSSASLSRTFRILSAVPNPPTNIQ